MKGTASPCSDDTVGISSAGWFRTFTLQYLQGHNQYDPMVKVKRAWTNAENRNDPAALALKDRHEQLSAAESIQLDNSMKYDVSQVNDFIAVFSCVSEWHPKEVGI